MTTVRDFARPRDPPATFESPTLLRFVLVSMLVHALLLLVFGTSPGGRGAQRGDGSWGGLDVTLRRLTPEPGSGIKLAPGDETTSPGAAIMRRWRGAPAAPTEATQEKSPAAPSSQPAAAPVVPATPNAVLVEPAPLPADTARPQEISPPSPSSPLEALPSLDRSAPEEADRPFAPAATTPPPKLERAPSPPAEPKVRDIPALPAPPVAPPPIERETAPSIEPPLREMPTPPTPAPIERVVPPKVEREITPAIEPPRESARPATPPVERIEPPKIEPQVAPPMEAPAPPTERVAPPTERIAPPTERVAPPTTIAPDRAPSPPAPARTEAPAQPGPRLRFGAPDPGDELFKPRGDAVAPVAGPGVAPRIDLEATGQRAREIVSEGSAYRGFVPAIPPPATADRKSKLADAIDKAQKPDCRDAYAAMGLLAVPALVVSTVGDGGCRW